MDLALWNPTLSRAVKQDHHPMGPASTGPIGSAHQVHVAGAAHEGRVPVGQELRCRPRACTLSLARAWHAGSLEALAVLSVRLS